MVERLLIFLRERMPLTAEGEAVVRSSVKPRRFEKGAFLQRAGEVARHGHFVVSGCLRSFSIDEKGREHVLQFAPEGWWLTDFASIREQVPSTFFIEALEDSDVLLIDWPSHDRLVSGLPGYAAAMAAGLSKGNAAREQRLMDTMSLSAEDRYLKFLEAYPSIAQRVPQHMVASYLGVTPETLSRIRGQFAKKKRPRDR